jgi:hypothetical protein
MRYKEKINYGLELETSPILIEQKGLKPNGIKHSINLSYIEYA